jgi:phosphatidylserine decarboxylase
MPLRFRIPGLTHVSDRSAVLPQYLFPKQALTNFAGWVAGKERGAVTTWIIRRFVAKYSVNMGEALESDITYYKSFNQFFTRALKPGARPLAQADLVCPVDGAISQFGRSRATRSSRPRATATRPPRWSAATPRWPQVRPRHFATLYLSAEGLPPHPHALRRAAGAHDLRAGRPVLGQPADGAHVPGLFARNERVVCVFESAHGPFVLVLVGATIVGSMATVWHGVVNPPRVRELREWNYSDQQIDIRKGDEMGRFLLGSTVVMLFPAPALAFNPDWSPTRAIQLGEAMANYTNL